jgi:hypothetical protein
MPAIPANVRVLQEAGVDISKQQQKHGDDVMLYFKKNDPIRYLN